MYPSNAGPTPTAVLGCHTSLQTHLKLLQSSADTFIKLIAVHFSRHAVPTWLVVVLPHQHLIGSASDSVLVLGCNCLLPSSERCTACLLPSVVAGRWMLSTAGHDLSRKRQWQTVTYWTAAACIKVHEFLCREPGIHFLSAGSGEQSRWLQQQANQH